MTFKTGQNKNTDIKQKRWLPPFSLFFYADGLPACLEPAACLLLGLCLLFLFILLEEGRGAELLLLLGVG